MAKVELVGIHKMYEGNTKYSVSDFNLKIEEKEFIVFVGPSGCGKSTTLRMIAGLEEISGGELYIDGVLVNDLPPKDRGIAMVFQSYALYPHMTVFDNMAFGLKIQRLPKDVILERVHEAARILEIEHYLQRKPRALSGGERQRVALGRAIVRQTQVVLMDEPLSNLDAKLRVQMRSEIIRLHEKLGSTTIYVTHDQTEAMTMATRIVVMKDGFVQQVGSPIEIYHNPDNLFVASFIGSPPMNFFNVLVGKDHLEFFRHVKKEVEVINEETGAATVEEEVEVVKDGKLPIPSDLAKKLAPYVGKHVIFGVRPENVNYASSEVGREFKDFHREIEVEIAELLGNEYIVHSNLFGQKLVSKLLVDPQNAIHIGAKLQLVIDFNKVAFFKVDTPEEVSTLPHAELNKRIRL
ncbi:MAG: sn-glycerol-3-phosphate ABC transporter ATP-binding protein UgpC [Bacilli bacterium]|nr:sn-glycerol-3-phosphate ABC transporter ATP-binding protein UgpC [Bacilli bacterium]